MEVAEVEPNDTSEQPQVLGLLRPGECFTISGDVASEDNLDGYRISMDEPQTISAILTHGSEVDFDLGFFRVDVDDFVAICLAEESPEICSAAFSDTMDDLDVIVNSFAGTGAYTLEIFSTANAAPVTDAGPDQNVATGLRVTLDGSGSSDADGDLLFITWVFVSVPDGSVATLSDSTAVNPTFTADVTGTYVVRLVANDGTVSVFDMVTITVTS
jgi:hypothetical protein